MLTLFAGFGPWVAGARPAAADPAPEGYATARVREVGIALEYPRHWTELPSSRRAVLVRRRELRKTNPALVREFSRQAQVAFEKRKKFSAVDLEASLDGRGSGNVAVSLMTGFPASFEEFDRGARADMTLLGAEVLASEVVQVSGREAYRIDFRMKLKAPDGSDVVILGAMSAVPVGSTGVIVAVGAPEGPDAAELVDHVLASVRHL